MLTSDPTIKMQWLKDNKPMEDKLADRVTTTITDNVCKLEIQNVHESDSGIYIARALNANGEATCTAQLVVQQRKIKCYNITILNTINNSIFY